MDKFRRMMQINIDGSMITAQAAARLMRNSGQGGSILLVASMSGAIANKVSSAFSCRVIFLIFVSTSKGVYCSAYNASKAACLQLGRSLAVEWAEYNIRVNTLSPGYIRTAMTNMLLEGRPYLLEKWQSENPMNRIATPSEFKGPAVFLLSNASSFMTGSDLRVDGGVSLRTLFAL
jgi:NAD(P)-dependent dehydrogenase (short-subunit alcohol dehydrogenase family)